MKEHLTIISIIIGAVALVPWFVLYVHWVVGFAR